MTSLRPLISALVVRRAARSSTSRPNRSWLQPRALISVSGEREQRQARQRDDRADARQETLPKGSAHTHPIMCRRRSRLENSDAPISADYNKAAPLSQPRPEAVLRATFRTVHAGKTGGAEGRQDQSKLASRASMSSCLPASSGNCGPFSSFSSAVFGFGCCSARGWRLAVFLDLVAERRDQRLDPILDVLQRLHHLGDALAGDVLEVAGFVDLGDRVR